MCVADRRVWAFIHSHTSVLSVVCLQERWFGGAVLEDDEGSSPKSSLDELKVRVPKPSTTTHTHTLILILPRRLPPAITHPQTHGNGNRPS